MSFSLAKHMHTQTKVPEECLCRWAQHLPLWLRGIMRRYEWQCVFYCPLSHPPSPPAFLALTDSFGWQSDLLIPQCSGINADDAQPFEGCVSVRFKCLLSSGSWQGMHTCGRNQISCYVRPPSADCVVQESTKQNGESIQKTICPVKQLHF